MTNITLMAGQLCRICLLLQVRFKYRCLEANLQRKNWNLWVFHLAGVQKRVVNKDGALGNADSAHVV